MSLLSDERKVAKMFKSQDQTIITSTRGGFFGVIIYPMCYLMRNANTLTDLILFLFAFKMKYLTNLVIVVKV